MSAAPAARYRLGCLTSLYSSLPLDAALERIRKLGYRYAVPGRTHAGQIVYAAECWPWSSAGWVAVGMSVTRHRRVGPGNFTPSRSQNRA